MATIEEITADPRFGKFTFETQISLLKRLKGDEVAQQWATQKGPEVAAAAKASGEPTIGESKRPLPPEPSSTSDMLSRVQDFFTHNNEFNNESLERGDPSPGGSDVAQRQFDATHQPPRLLPGGVPSVADTPLNETDLAAGIKGAAGVAAPAMAPAMAALTPAALITSLVLGTGGEAALAPVGRAVGTEVGMPETGETVAGLLGGLVGGVKGAGPHEGVPEAPGLMAALRSRVANVLEGIRRIGNPVQGPSQTPKVLGELPPPMMDNGSALAERLGRNEAPPAAAPAQTDGAGTRLLDAASHLVPGGKYFRAGRALLKPRGAEAPPGATPPPVVEPESPAALRQIVDDAANRAAEKALEKARSAPPKEAEAPVDLSNIRQPPPIKSSDAAPPPPAAPPKPKGPDIMDMFQTDLNPETGRAVLPTKPSGITVEMQPISSRGFRAAGYNPESRTMQVEFNDGKQYQYHGVKQEEFDTAM